MHHEYLVVLCYAAAVVALSMAQIFADSEIQQEGFADGFGERRLVVLAEAERLEVLSQLLMFHVAWLADVLVDILEFVVVSVCFELSVSIYRLMKYLKHMRV